MFDSEDIPEVPLRPLVWMGDSRKNIRAFPQEVRVSVGYALQLVQAGETPLDAKPFKRVGSGVLEDCQTLRYGHLQGGLCRKDRGKDLCPARFSEEIQERYQNPTDGR